MRICFFAPANNYHIIKWASWFVSKGNDVYVISFDKVNDPLDGIIYHHLRTGASSSSNSVNKLKYLTAINEFETLVSRINPDIVSVHYASSYGFIAALSKVDNYVLSVWGGDVLVFPQKSIFHKYLIKYSLKKAPHILSTSLYLHNEILLLSDRHSDITPFGVNMELFNPNKRTVKKQNRFIIGTVKGLKDIYGIDTLLNATAIVISKNPEIKIQLRIAGSGDKEQVYKNLGDELGISDHIKWLGYISQEEAAIEWANMDIAIIPSFTESFGVSAIEAEASGTALIVSDIDGLRETVLENRSCILFRPGDANELANIIVYLYYHPHIRDKMGTEGRNFVASNFELNQCFFHISNLFEKYRS